MSKEEEIIDSRSYIRLKQVYEKAAEANYHETYRQGHLVELPSEGDLLVFGDIHGNLRNFAEIMALADLANHPQRHVILQEATHTYAVGEDKSYLLHEKMALFKVKYPDRVHIILGNHELSEITGREILKGGICYNILFNQGLKQYYERYYPEVVKLLHAYMRAMPLACRTANGFFISHSIPPGKFVHQYSLRFFRQTGTSSHDEAKLTERLVWGRDLSAKTAAHFARQVEARWLVVGHTACKCGFQLPNDRMVILDSKDALASFLYIRLDRPYTYEEVKTDCIKRLYHKLIRETWAIRVLRQK